jgi:hypothetical protein
MVKFLNYIFILSVAFFLSACSQKPSDVLKEIQKKQVDGSYNNLNAYYTNGTVKAIAELDKLYQKKKAGKAGEDKRFADGARWDVIAEKLNGNDAEVIIKYAEHPVQNMIGLELMFRLRNEDGKWKLDAEKEILKSMEMLKNSGKTDNAGKKDYLNRMKHSLKTGAEEEN